MSSKRTNPIFCAYIPVFHRGWERFFATYLPHPTAPATLLLVSSDQLRPYAPTHKDLQALDVRQIQLTLQSLYPHWQIKLFSPEETQFQTFCQQLFPQNAKNCELILPDDSALISYIEKNLSIFSHPPHLTISPIWLRWEKSKIPPLSQESRGASALTSTTSSTTASSLTPTDHLDSSFDLNFPLHSVSPEFYARLHQVGERSGDFWRQVGAIATTPDGAIILESHNTHLPHSDQPYRDGDMRAQFHRGQEIEATTAIHAEAKLIATAASRGISLKSAHLYLTDFPCPTCAKLISQSGITHLYFERGYAVWDGLRVLTSAQIKIFQLQPPATS